MISCALSLFTLGRAFYHTAMLREEHCTAQREQYSSYSETSEHRSHRCSCSCSSCGCSYWSCSCGCVYCLKWVEMHKTLHHSGHHRVKVHSLGTTFWKAGLQACQKQSLRWCLTDCCFFLVSSSPKFSISLILAKDFHPPLSLTFRMHLSQFSHFRSHHSWNCSHPCLIYTRAATNDYFDSWLFCQLFFPFNWLIKWFTI